MTERNDELLDDVLAQHFSDELDAQLGRASARFAQEIGSPPIRLADRPIVPGAKVPAARRGGNIFWSLGLVGSALAASIVIVVSLNGREHTRPWPGAKPTVNPAIVDNDDDAQRTIAYRTLDEGTVYVSDSNVPVRQIRRQALDTVSWIDRKHGDEVQVTLPHDDIVLVGLNKY